MSFLSDYESTLLNEYNFMIFEDGMYFNPSKYNQKIMEYF